MSGIITLVIALILLVAAVYNLISYIRDRRSASLPSKNQALKVVKAVFSLPRRDWPAHLFALLRAQKAPADRQGPQSVANRDVAAPPAGRCAPRVTGGPHPALISGTHDGLALEGASE